MKILRIIALFLTVAILFSSCAFDYSVAMNAEDVMNFDCEELGVAEVTFATNYSAAKTLAKNASPTGRIREDLNERGDGYYPHIHPIGLKWYASRKSTSYVHIWFPRK